MAKPTLQTMQRTVNAQLRNRWSVYFSDGIEIFVTAKSDDAAERIACKQRNAAPDIKPIITMNLGCAAFLRTL